MFRRAFSKILIASSLLCLASQVNAFCSEFSMYSSPPSPPGGYSKPSAPMCLSSYQFSGEHDCTDWELNNYIDEVNEYIRKLSNYAQDAAGYAEDARAFANDALAYAECEIEETKEPLN